MVRQQSHKLWKHVYSSRHSGRLANLRAGVQPGMAAASTEPKPRGVQVTIKRPEGSDEIEGPWLWLDTHPERGVTLNATVIGIKQPVTTVKLERPELEKLRVTLDHILDAEGDVTLESMEAALASADL